MFTPLPFIRLPNYHYPMDVMGFNKIQAIIFIILISNLNAFAAPISQITNIAGYSYYEGELLKAGQQYPIKVGGVIAVKGEASYAEGLFQNIIFRVVDGKMSIEKSVIKKERDASEHKIPKEGFKLHEGKVFIHITKSFGESALQLKMPKFNLLFRGLDAKPITAVYASATKENLSLYVHRGSVKIIIPGREKTKICLTEGNYWEYTGPKINQPYKFDDERKLKKLLPVFEQLKVLALEKLGESPN